MQLISVQHRAIGLMQNPELLAKHSEGLIALTGGTRGPLNRLLVEGQNEAAGQLLDRLQAIFRDRLYVELQRHGLAEERATEDRLLSFAYDRAFPLVATNDVHFALSEMYEAHDAVLCIADGTFVSQEDRKRVTREHRFKSPAEMAAQFADLPEAMSQYHRDEQGAVHSGPKNVIRSCQNSSEIRSYTHGRIARGGGSRIGATSSRFTANMRTRRSIAIGWPSSSMFFPHGFRGLFPDRFGFHEMDARAGHSGWRARFWRHSLVAWSLDITNLDPIRFGLLFERFLNPERISMPDFDIDFLPGASRRSRALRAAQIWCRSRRTYHRAWFASGARGGARCGPRAADAARSRGPIAKLVPNPPGKPVSLRDAVAGEPRLQAIAEQEPAARKLFAIVEHIEGLYRHASTHPAGVVIGDRPLDEVVPLYRDPRSEMPVTQFDYEDAEKAGLVKFDFLGLKTLTVIAKAEALLKRRGIMLDTQNIAFEDPATFEMLSRGESVGVFQLEGAGMRDLLRKMRPDHINDLVALVALYRPGPMDSIPKYIACKRGREQPDYLHPMLEPILAETFGVMTYQEDVMRIARELGGYSMGQADLLRRAMGKKIPGRNGQARRIVCERRRRTRHCPGTAVTIFEQAAKFAGYGFNKGHAAAYAQVAYQTAYLKANYPVEFMAASMTLDIGSTDRLNIFRQEAGRLGIKVAPPDINKSDSFFTCDNEAGLIFYALAAVKGVGRQAMEHVVAIRESGGAFRSISDFAHRVDSKLVNRRAFESLARAGAFDRLNNNRHQLVESSDAILSHSASTTRERESGQVSLFGGGPVATDELRLTSVANWLPHERLSEEFAAIGFYLSGHPLDSYGAAMKRLGVVSWAQLQEDRRRSNFRAVIAGTIIRKQERRGRNDQPYGFLSLSDPTGMFEVMVFSEVLLAARPLLEAGRAVLLSVSADWTEEELKLRALSVSDLEKAAADASEGLRIVLADTQQLGAIAGQMRGQGKGIVTLVVPGAEGQDVEIRLKDRHAITPAMKSAIQSLPGVMAVESL